MVKQLIFIKETIMSLFATEVPSNSTDEMIDFFLANCEDELVEYELREFITTACFTEEELAQEDLPQKQYYAKFMEKLPANDDPRTRNRATRGYIVVLTTDIETLIKPDAERNVRFLQVKKQKIVSVDKIEISKL